MNNNSTLKEFVEHIDDTRKARVTKAPKDKKPKALKICNVANQPILPHDTMLQIQSAVAQFLGQERWYEWGMKTYRKQGSLVVMYGPPGCGKTTSARYLTQIIKRPLSIMDMGTIGSNEPGGAERNIKQFFANAEENQATVFLDEADSILWERNRAGGDSMWMVSVINTLLVELSEYRHLCIIATNREEHLDAAIESRVIAKVHVAAPDHETRKRLWEVKVPKKYPLQLSPVQTEMLAHFKLTGRTIEGCIFKAAQLAILNGTVPTFDSLCNVAKELEGK